ncbi:MAG TPA: tetratricopeptide repeat protein [Gemmataceae bacterium]|nr:tetratricopeptide repeat protein [Gemmataceae bacterium]
MGILHEIIHDYPVLAVATVGLIVWALIDLSTRQVESYWVWVILLLPGVGALVYLFAVVRPNLRSLGSSWFTPRPSLDELRYRAEQAPTLTNHLALAERLIEGEDFAAAIPHLEEAHKREPEHGQVLYSLAYCHVQEGRAAAAVPLLEQLTQREPRWWHYTGWHLLITAQDEAGDRPAAVASCRELVRLSPTLEHSCLLAERLLQDGQTGEVQLLLQRALQDYEFAPGSSRRRNRRWAGEARRLLRQATAARQGP